jgi:NAD(P)H-hydrate epimerase
VSREETITDEHEKAPKDPVIDDRVGPIADLLHEAGEIHHVYFKDTDGADDDWATFYSDWLLAHSALPVLLGRRPVRSHLTRDLVACDEQYGSDGSSEPWPRWYARKLIERYG